MIFINILFILFNVVLFLNGLLPIRTNTIQFNNVESKIHEFSSGKKFDHTVIMIVDAIRADFVNNEYMPLTTNLIKDYGCLINVSVASPTVTLPRIKSLITGSVPQFMDLLHNLGSPQAVEDSLLHQARKRDNQIVFYGDDTWLKIFPDDLFLRYSGTTSFYVTDFYEVDNNVTNHLDAELRRSDWDIMILHYLGLDHIGHVHGPFSDLVPPKLHEMDEIFSSIFESLLRKNVTPLVILTGDHGMRDSGGHGGSTYSETTVPLGILGVPCDAGVMDQVDITPNLAIFLNYDIPSSSIGKLSRIFLKNLTLDEFLVALDYNVQLLSNKHVKSPKEFQYISDVYKSYLETGDKKLALEAIQLYTDYSEKVSRSLIEAASQQDTFVMIVSVMFLIYSLITHLNRREIFKTPLYNCITYLMLLVARLFSYDSILLVPCLIALIFQLMRYWQMNMVKLKYIFSTPVTVFLIFLQPLTWLSSSFIEEEHEFWYFIINTFFVFQIFQKVKHKNIASFVSWVAISICYRFAETINQIGDKWASMPDSSDFLLKPENFHLHLVLLCCSIFSIYHFCFKFRRSKYYLDKIILFLIFIYKIKDTNIILARIIYTLLLIHLAVGLDYLNSWILLISFLSKSYNLCLIPLSVYTSSQISKEYRSNVLSNSLHLILSKSLYFMQGNGNNIANIDITVGYTALSQYAPVLVGAQLLINTYSGIILIHMLLFISSNESEASFNFVYTERLYTALVVCIVSFIFRNHIFIWTVYAPKLCIECCHTLICIMEFLFYSLISFCVHKIACNK